MSYERDPDATHARRLPPLAGCATAQQRGDAAVAVAQADIAACRAPRPCCSGESSTIGVIA
jgi:hypothetical protein